MRGKHFFTQKRVDTHRITPAYAGKTRVTALIHLAARDHPRVCGENNAAARAKIAQIGSPPRMRGKLSSYLIKGFIIRITPAYAGKTADFETTTNINEDHPRVCGEN